MHLWIKIEGTLEDLRSETHTHTPPPPAPATHTQISNVSPSIGPASTPSYMQCTVYRVAFPPVPCCLGLPGKEEGVPGSAPLRPAGLLAKAQRLRWRSLWRDKGEAGGAGRDGHG